LLRGLASDRDRLQKLKQNARQTAGVYTTQRMASEYLAVYEGSLRVG